MTLTEDQRIIRDTVRSFSQTELKPNSALWAKESRFPHAALQEMAALGLFGMTVPEKWGGANADTVSLVLALEEVAAGDGACSTILSVNNSVVCGPILKFGSEYLKKTYLNPLAHGQMLGCFCLTESHAGSDASAIRTRAEKDEDEYIINGTKQFITSGQNAQVAIVFAVTDAAAGKKGISAFVVPTQTEGYRVVKIEDKMGQSASDTAEIEFSQCRVPASHLLGQEGQGYKIALSNLEAGRIGIAAQCVGMARAAYEIAKTYSTERMSFGKTIIQHQAVGFRLADMATQLQAAHLMTLEAARLKDIGEPCLQQASMAKLFASESAEKICSDAIQILGGYGYIRDFGVEQIARDVRVAQIYEGSSDIQRMVIARNIQSESTGKR
ncbi:MAG: acyl-CoA dehydrogenase [Gammaproteobacteria bacterium]|nr:acyl-CoA dehydrogenase [Gammaproteobacteria bacterium]